MTLTAPRRATTSAAALLLLAITALTGCGAPLEATSPAPSTWAIPTEAAVDARTASNAPAGETTVEPSTDPASNPASGAARPLATDTAQPTDIPTATAEISNPTYDINNVDRGDPAQVAWAYLTHRLGHSYTDPAPDAGLTAAAQYATPELANQAADQATAAAADTWDDVQKSQRAAVPTITHLTVYTEPDRTTVIASWTLTVLATGQPSRVTPGLSTSLLLTQLSGTGWLVSADGLHQPD